MLVEPPFPPEFIDVPPEPELDAPPLPELPAPDAPPLPELPEFDAPAFPEFPELDAPLLLELDAPLLLELDAPLLLEPAELDVLPLPELDAPVLGLSRARGVIATCRDQQRHKRKKRAPADPVHAPESARFSLIIIGNSPALDSLFSQVEPLCLASHASLIREMACSVRLSGGMTVLMFDLAARNLRQ